MGTREETEEVKDKVIWEELDGVESPLPPVFTDGNTIVVLDSNEPFSLLPYVRGICTFSV